MKQPPQGGFFIGGEMNMSATLERMIHVKQAIPP